MRRARSGAWVCTVLKFFTDKKERQHGVDAYLGLVLLRRREREYQRHSRGGARSPTDLYENAAIMAAWEAGEITEGQAMNALELDRVQAREAKLALVALGRSLALALANP